MIKKIDFSTGRPVFFLKIPALLFILSLFCGSAAAQEIAPSRDAYVSSGTGDARTLIPLAADDVASGSLCNLIYNGLTKVDKDLNITGDLAESWEVQEGGLSILFHLRHGVKWHDGEAFTAEDVRFTFETILDPGTGCPYISSYRDISGIDVIDDHTIRFVYSHPYAPALLKFGMGIIPEHLFRGVKDMRASVYSGAPVGTGPYKFVKWERGQYVILESNNAYFEHIPGIKRYVYRVVPDQTVQFLELVSGSIDSMTLDPYQFFYRSDTPRFRATLEKYRYLDHSYSYIGYNFKDSLLGDRRIRQALSCAVNKRRIIDSVLLGLGEECTGPFLKGTPYYNDKAEGYAYDPHRSAALLREAGWYDEDDDGILEKDGQEFRLKIMTNQGSRIREDIAVLVQDQWRALGIKAEVQVAAWSAFLDQFVNKKNFQVVILGWTVPIDPDIYTIWHTDSAGKGGLNFISYSNGEVDRLIELGRREFDTEKRVRIYRRIHELIAEDAPYTFLFFPYATPAVHKRFKGIDPAPAGIGYNFIDWHVPADEVKYKL